MHQQIPPRLFTMRTRAELLLYMRYTKEAISIQEQIQLLRERGLIINDEAFAEHFLSRVSYFRLAAYWRPMEADKEMHQFKENSTFENAVRLYHFDEKLRRMIFRAIQTIEIALRTQTIHVFSRQFGPFWFVDETLAGNARMQEENIAKVKIELKRAHEDFLKSHYKRYDEPMFPPAWKTLEVLSFGTLSKLFCNINKNDAKKEVARNFGLPQHLFLESWMISMAVLRNCCAHHGHLWNRKFSKPPQMPESLSRPWIDVKNVDRNKLYAQLSCLVYWYNSIEPNNGFVQEFKQLLEQYPEVDVKAMGFPNGWEDEPLWNVNKEMKELTIWKKIKSVFVRTVS